MFKNILTISFFIFFVNFAYSDSKNYQDFEKAMEQLHIAKKIFINFVENAKSSENIVYALNTLNKVMTQLQPKIIRLQNQFPELKSIHTFPIELEITKNQFETIQNQYLNSLQIIMIHYGSDEKVQAAFINLLKNYTDLYYSNQKPIDSKYEDVEKAYQSLIKAEETFMALIEKAETADDVVKAVKVLTDIMIKIKPPLVELDKKYPELKGDKNTPVNLKAVKEQFDTVNNKFAQVMQNLRAKFGNDEKVQKAFQDMINKLQ